MQPPLIRFGGYQKPASVHTRAAVRFGDLLKQTLGDRIEFELVGDVLALGHKSGDLPDMVESGKLSMCYISSLRFVRWVPQLVLFDLPFIVRDRAVAWRALDGALGRRLQDMLLAQSPYRLLAWWDNGFRHFSNKVRPIRMPADCRGIRIRTQMSPLQGESLRMLGFEPIAEDIKVFVEQVGGDRFQAQDNPLTNIYNFGVHRHHRYITLSGHVYGVACLVCNQAQFEAWPRDVQETVLAAAREVTGFQRGLAAAQDEEILNKLDPAENEVIQLSTAEHQSFVTAVKPITERYRRKLGDELFALIR